MPYTYLKLLLITPFFLMVIPIQSSKCPTIQEQLKDITVLGLPLSELLTKRFNTIETTGSQFTKANTEGKKAERGQVVAIPRSENGYSYGILGNQNDQGLCSIILEKDNILQQKLFSTDNVFILDKVLVSGNLDSFK